MEDELIEYQVLQGLGALGDQIEEAEQGYYRADHDSGCGFERYFLKGPAKNVPCPIHVCRTRWIRV